MMKAASSFGFRVGRGTLDNFASPSFTTHSSALAQKVHRLSELILYPTRFTLQRIARIIQPAPGNRSRALRRISSTAWTVLGIPFGAAALAAGLPLRALDHCFRPPFSYMKAPNAQEPRALEDRKVLHIRTHNLGLVPTSLSTLNDLSDPLERARTILNWIVEGSNQPDIIFFQEVFHEDAQRLLCEGLAAAYPYILHSICPTFLGLSSGYCVASKFPIDEIEFHRFHQMIGPEKLSQRGILRVRIPAEGGFLDLFALHAQAIQGKRRAKVRLAQYAQLEAMVAASDSAFKVILGDFNTSRLTLEGADNLDPPGQSEAAVYKALQESYDDIFLEDHDELGNRTKGARLFTDDPLPEPTGSWAFGPQETAGTALKKWACGVKRKRGASNRPVTWGTPEWQREQPACTARLDYILLPKESRLKGRAEVRRTEVPSDAASAPSDHLAVDALIEKFI